MLLLLLVSTYKYINIKTTSSSPMYEQLFDQIGLSSNERITYLGLLELGDSTRSRIVAKTSIAGSKIYDILERLKTKGLVSIYLKDNVKHFKALNPQQLLHYVEEQESALKEQKKQVQNILPQLTAQFLSGKSEQEVELLSGMKGIQTYFYEQVEELEKGDVNYVIGGTRGINDDHLVAFYRKIHLLREQKGIKTKMLYNKRQKQLVKQSYHQKEFPLSETKFIEHTSAVAINIFKNKTLITIFGKEVTGIKITSKDVAQSFVEYFDLLWKTTE